MDIVLNAVFAMTMGTVFFGITVPAIFGLIHLTQVWIGGRVLGFAVYMIGASWALILAAVSCALVARYVFGIQ